MSVSRITNRFPRTALTQFRNSLLFCQCRDHKYVSTLSNQFLSPHGPRNTVVPGQVSLLHHSALNSSAFQWFGFSSSASAQPSEKETAQTGNEQEDKAEGTPADQTEEFVSDEKNKSDLQSDLTRDDLVKLVVEKEELVKLKEEEHEKMKDTVLRTYAEMENAKERTRREAENTKKFAIQNFAKSLLDVADNLGRASAAARESFSKIDTSNDASGSIPQLKTLLEGVEMTEKQLTEVFKKFGIEKYNPINEEFDPNRHNAVFQVPDTSKAMDHVAVVLKAGYMLHDRVIRPAEVGVTVSVNIEKTDK
ncbi:Molecular chaperone of the family [Olea europaea subsp. europaea]|uniref:GrpE protein homolog n=1 Tax=Olea europaea subsp. europaea TaxID=158383 RepID=A0A8S0SY18_OLEEU|nr:Molecular chaperone of the family [Olea europaea subsp. europaea]